MLNLKLFTSLQGNNSASLLLKPSSPGQVQFFVMSASVNYNIVVSGECEGELPGATPLSFDVVLSSIVPLLDKNQQFRITYHGNTLRFVEVGERFSVEPLCVEHISDFAMDVAQKYLNVSKLLEEEENRNQQLGQLNEELQYLESNYKQLKIYELSGGPSVNPWGSPDDLENTSVDKKYAPRIAELKSQIEAMEKSSALSAIDMSKMKRLASIAAKYNTVVSLCDTYALVALKNSYIVQKQECGNRAVQGKLLHRLLQEETGKFYENNGELFFRSIAGKGKDRSETVVFLHSYLPNVQVDSSIVTKGSVREKYSINLKGMLPVVTAVLGKFDTMVFDMGKAELVMSNDRGEHLVHKFSMEDAQTLALNKAMRGEDVSSSEMTMACISVPAEVRRIIGTLRDNFTIFVKERKVVLQSDNLFVVFAR